MYPRLHLGPPTEEAQQATPVVSKAARLCAAFENVTGWALQAQPTRSPNYPCAVRVVPCGPEPVTSHATELSIAKDFAAAISDVLRELHQTRNELFRREAELAAGIPVAPRRREEEHLATRLEAILQGGAEAIGCQAAGLYMLDDATTELKLRSAWGLPQEQFLHPPRPLAEAFADLEAIVGHAVAIENASLLPHWQVPASYPAAVCVPVSSPTDPLGTLWFFADKTRDFTDEQTNLAEIVAGRVASELQREVLLNECVAAKQTDRQQLCATQWQHDHLPNVTPQLDDWQVAGWSADGDELATGFYDWFVPPDGSLAIALGVGAGTPLESALGAAALQSSVRSHANYGRAAVEVMGQVNETIWFGSAGGHFASLAYGVIRPDQDEIEIAALGNIQALIVRAGHSEAVLVEQTELGVEPELALQPQRFRMSGDDLLILLPAGAGLGSLQPSLGEVSQQNRGTSAQNLAALIQQKMPDIPLGLVLRRR